MKCLFQTNALQNLDKSDKYTHDNKTGSTICTLRLSEIQRTDLFSLCVLNDSKKYSC